MNLVKWTTVSELDSMERRMRRLFEEVGLAPALTPAADVYETDDEFVVELEVPGYEETELAIEVSDHVLRITGSRETARDEQTKAFVLHERLAREFERRFALPGEADTRHLRASFENGVLAVRAPKTQAARPTQVEISRTD